MERLKAIFLVEDKINNGPFFAFSLIRLLKRRGNFCTLEDINKLVGDNYVRSTVGAFIFAVSAERNSEILSNVNLLREKVPDIRIISVGDEKPEWADLTIPKKIYLGRINEILSQL